MCIRDRYLPWIKDAVIRDDVINDDNMTYWSVTGNTKGDRTIPDPVSYTHLDVYKRQTHARSDGQVSHAIGTY